MVGFLLAFAAAACSYVSGVRLVKRRAADTKVAIDDIIDEYFFHFEPSFKDRRACDSGRVLNESECRAAHHMITRVTSNAQSFKGSDTFDAKLGARKPSGCYINVYKGGWKILYNPYAGPPEETKPGQWWQAARLCTGRRKAQWTFFELGDRGRQECPRSIPLDRGDCLVASLQETFRNSISIGRKHSLKYLNEHWHGHLADDPAIPTGCSIRTGTDWTFHFKSTEGGSVGHNFSRVCGPERSYAQVASSLAASSNSVQQSRSNSSDALSYGTCCVSYTCNICGSRRRHSRTSVTYCPWYADIGCCKGGHCKCQLT